MILSDEKIEEFRKIYKDLNNGKEISREVAYDQGIKLIRLLKIIYKPMTYDDYERLQYRSEEHLDAIAASIEAQLADDSI